MKNWNPRKKRHSKQAAYEHCQQSCLDCLQKHPGGGIHITSGSSPVMPRWTNCKTAHPTKPEQCHKQNSFTTANSSLDHRIPHELRLLGGPKQARTHTKISHPRKKRLNQQAASGNRRQSCLDSLRKRPDGGVHKHLWLFTLIPRPGPQTPTTAKLPTQQNQSDVANAAHLKRQILAWVPESHMGAAAGASAPRRSPQRNPKDHHSKLTTSREGCSKHLYLPAGMLCHDAAIANPSFPAQPTGIPLIFPGGRHPAHESGKMFAKASACGRKTGCNFSRTQKMADFTPSPPPRGTQLASGHGKLS